MQTPSFAVARDQCSLKNIAIAELHPSIEAHSLEDGAELVRALANTLARANLLAPVIGVRLGIFIGRVLNVEHGLAIVDELVKGFAFRVLIVARALLIDRKVHQVHHLINNVGRVLETDRHVVLGGLVMQKLHVVNRVLGRKTQVVFRILLETVPLVSNTNTSVKQKKTYKTVDVVGVNGITALAGRQRDALPHDVTDFGAADASPTLVYPFGQSASEILLGKVIRVRTILLPRPGAKVAQDLLVEFVQLVDGFLVILKHVKVPDGNIWCEIDISADGVFENDLPRVANLGRPL